MRDKIIEVLKRHETSIEDHHNITQEVIRDWEYKAIAEETEKLTQQKIDIEKLKMKEYFESHIKTGVVDSGFIGSQAVIDAGCQLVNDFVSSEVKDD